MSLPHRYKLPARLVSIIVCASLSACGGGGGNDPSSSTPTHSETSSSSTSSTTIPDTSSSSTSSTTGSSSASTTSPATGSTSDQTPAPQLTQLFSTNKSGTAVTYSATGPIDPNNPFFKPFGNGRTCASCHQQDSGWTITPSAIQLLFNVSQGLDPLFMPVDGANSPLADISTMDARRAAYSMLLTKGVIRVGIGIPANAEFDLVTADDPYGYASAKELSLFRRPLPSTNLKFLSTVMWDARETYHDSQSNVCIAGTTNCFRPLDFNLGNQANNAVLGHAQAATGLTAADQTAIVNFEKGLFTAQLIDNDAQNLTAVGANGGAFALSQTDFYFGINDLTGDYRTKAPFTPNAMTLYDAWVNGGPDQSAPGSGTSSQPAAVNEARKSIARGQQIFNNRTFNISNVAGLNDDFNISVVKGTCTTCHNVPNAGSHPTPLLFNIGIADGNRRSSDLPLYTLRNKQTGEVIQTTDPGLAMQSGKWQDIGRFKVPTLRGLASRAPYFHNGSANDLSNVVGFYNARFNIGLSPQEITDLTNFLKAL